MVMPHLLVVVEGDTEDIFYRSLIGSFQIRGKMETGYMKTKGIGNFHTNIRKIEVKVQGIKRDAPDDEIAVLLCYDLDVFEPRGGQLQIVNPPPNPESLKRKIIGSGASQVYFLKPSRTIEDWIMLNSHHVLQYLNLRFDTKIKGSDGLSKMKYLYKLRNRVYDKNAMDVQELVKNLDFSCIKENLPEDAKDTLAGIFS
jgi:hypothetical protein